MKKYVLMLLLFMCSNALAVTECNERIVKYYVGTSQVNESSSHLWVSFEGGGSAVVTSESKAYEGMLSTVLTAVVTKNRVIMRYFANNASCKMHHSDWIGLWFVGD